MSDSAIRVENLSKQYRIGVRQPRYKTLRESLTDAVMAPVRRLRSTFQPSNLQPSNDETIWALKDVSFDVKHGEVIGIIGRNGAGKSTLLKVLSRITEPTAGRVEVYGRVGSLLEVGTGFHPELTGRENIYLNGAILGMHRAEIESKFDEIVAFAEVEKFIDTPVKHYSSGMYVRLAFAVAAHLEPEILLVDEVLAVGDAAFQKKCMGKMGDVARIGRTVLFVSHNMAAVANLCNRGLLLEGGRVRFDGSQAETIFEYQKVLAGGRGSLHERADRVGTGGVRVVGIELRDVSGNTVHSAASGQNLELVFHYEATLEARRRRLTASFLLKTAWDAPVFLQHNRLSGDEFGDLPERGAFVCRLKRLPLPPSTYRIAYSIMDGLDCLDGIDDAAELTVISGDFFGSGEVPPVSHGVCLVEGRWRVEPAGPASAVVNWPCAS